MLSILKFHSKEHGEKILHNLPDRKITYRRFWARIERASARLQCEWGVKYGDLVTYIGNTHPDIMVLYFALIRVGAFFLPAENFSKFIIEKKILNMNLSHIICDESFDNSNFISYSLSSLLSTWSHHTPDVYKTDTNKRSLLILSEKNIIEEISLKDLRVSENSKIKSPLVKDKIFKKENLINIIIPSLVKAKTLKFFNAKYS